MKTLGIILLIIGMTSLCTGLLLLTIDSGYGVPEVVVKIIFFIVCGSLALLIGSIAYVGSIIVSIIQQKPDNNDEI